LLLFFKSIIIINVKRGGRRLSAAGTAIESKKAEKERDYVL